MSSEEKLLLIKVERAKLNRCYTDEILIIIAEELISLNKSLNNTTESFNHYLNSIEYYVRTKE